MTGAVTASGASLDSVRSALATLARRVPPPPSLRVTATYNAPAIPAIGFALPDVGDALFTQERAERGARVVERDTTTFTERASWAEPDVPLPALRRPLGVSPDGALLVVYDFAAGQHGLRFIRRADEETWVVPIRGHWYRLQWSRDGGTVLSTGSGTATWVDVAARAPLDHANRPLEEYSAVTRARFVRRGQNQLAIVAREGLRELASWALPARASLRWCAADAALDALWCAVSLSERHELRRYSLRANEVPSVTLGEPWLDVFARGDEAAVLTRSGRVARVACAGGALTLRWLPPSTVPLPFVPWSVDASSTDGRRAVVSRGRRFAVVDLDTGETRTPASLTAGARGALTSSRGGDRVAVAHDDGAVAVLRADTLSPEVTFELGPPPCGLAFAPDGRALHAWSGDAWTALDLGDGSSHVVAELPALQGGGEATYGDGDVSPDGRFGAVSIRRAPEGAAEWLRVDLARGAVTPMPSPGAGNLRGVRFSGDGRLVTGLRGDWGPWRTLATAIVRVDAATGERVDEATALAYPGVNPAAVGVVEQSVCLGPHGAFAVAVDPIDHYGQRLCVVRASGVSAADGSLHGARVLASSPTLAALVENATPRDLALTLRELETLAVVASRPWPAEDSPRGACFVAGDALVVACGDGRLVRLEIDDAR